MHLLKILLIILFISAFNLYAQDITFNRLDFLLGKWSGEGRGFGNNASKIHSEFKMDLAGQYISATNDSKFDPTEKNPQGEHHIDKGFISFDKNRKMYVFRQFNIEGYVNQYVLVDSLSNENRLVFVTENIENFMPGGQARWTITKISANEIETTFDVSFPGKDYICMGTNHLIKDE